MNTNWLNDNYLWNVSCKRAKNIESWQRFYAGTAMLVVLINMNVVIDTNIVWQIKQIKAVIMMMNYDDRIMINYAQRVE